MSNTNEAKSFFEALETEEGLHARFEEIVKRISEAGEVKGDGEVICAAAKELGYTLTVGDLERFFASKEELDPDELESAAGGRERQYRTCSSDYECPSISAKCSGVAICYCVDVVNNEDEHGHDYWCATAWHCFVTTLHTESKEKKGACWSDYQCFFSETSRYFPDH